jgi:F-box protein 30
MEDIGGGVDYDGEINVNEPVIRAQPNDINNEYDTHPSEKDEHATHCDNCVHLSKCKRERLLRKSRPEEIPSSCPIVSCRFNCGWEFHECKSDEHDLLCSKAKVHCINKEYGCPFVLERRRRGQHLETCPAR